MNHQHSLWFDAGKGLEVAIHQSIHQNHVCIVFGNGISHTNWFMSETDLDTLIDNLLKAQMKYVQESKHE